MCTEHCRRASLLPSDGGAGIRVAPEETPTAAEAYRGVAWSVREKLFDDFFKTNAFWQ
jgi:hypothetical protein